MSLASAGAPVEAHLLARVARLKKQHEEERAAVEMEIESHPLEPQFSGKIQALLQQEDEAGRSGSRDRRDAVGNKVDLQMREECRAAMRYIVDLHSKQRDKVYQTHIAQREALTREILREVAAVRSGGSTPSSSLLPSLGPGSSGGAGAVPATHEEASFGSREAALRKHAERSWANGEKFNLMQAFQRQVDRIVVEWGGYLDAMAREYVTEVSKLEGSDPGSALAALEATKAGTGADSKGKWLDKEKQEQLVHTAPVLSPSAKSPSFSGGEGSAGPDSGAGPSAAGPRAGRGGASSGPAVPLRAAPSVSPAVKRQLQDLRHQFETAKKEVVLQRDTAIRWVLRQRNRMFMQVDAVEAERQFRAVHEAREESLFAALEKHVVSGLGR